MRAGEREFEAKEYMTAPSASIPCQQIPRMQGEGEGRSVGAWPDVFIIHMYTLVTARRMWPYACMCMY